jgi:Tol biopolymer transport system component
MRRNSPNARIFRISLTSHEAVDLGEMPAGSGGDPAWAEPWNSILTSRTVLGLTNIWKYSLQDRSLTQITFGTGIDYSPMPDPDGKGIYFLNGRPSGSLTAYWGFRTMPISVPGMPITGSGLMAITIPA